MRIVVTSGYNKSLHAIALVHLLAAQGQNVVLCLQVRLFNIARLRFYLHQVGLRKLISKIQRAGFWPGKIETTSVYEEVRPMLDYFCENKIHSKTVGQACKAVRARLVNVSSLNSPKALDALRQADADLVVYAGGGILRKYFIQTPKVGVLNAHAGPLPQFRGMNATEWALFHGVKPKITFHYIDCGIDTGEILFSKSVSTDALASVYALRGRATRVSVEGLLEVVKRISEGKIQPVAQDINAGRQFFVMADPLLEVLKRWIVNRSTPMVDCENFKWPKK